MRLLIDGTLTLAANVLLLAALASCDKRTPSGGAPPHPAPSGTARAPVPTDAPAAEPGSWYRATLAYPSTGELAFFLHVPPPGTDGRAYALNRDEITDMTATWQGNALTIQGPWTYVSKISAERAPDTSVLKGTWTRTTPLWGEVVRDFVATPIATPDPKLRYPAKSPPATSVTGSWKFDFEEHKDGKGVLEQTPDGVVTGYIRPGQLGDIRVLSGSLEGTKLALSHFNGNSANLILADVSQDGTKMSGVMSMQNVWNEKFVATKSAAFEHIKRVKLKVGKTSVTLKGLDKYKGKPTLAIVFATWCPVCNDATPFLRKLYEAYHPQGLEVLGVSYDLSDDATETSEAVAAYRARYKLPWELLSVLCTPDSWAESMPPEVEGWDGFPILLLVRPDGKVQTVYGGWFGSTTGADGDKLRAWFEDEVKKLVATK